MTNSENRQFTSPDNKPSWTMISIECDCPKRTSLAQFWSDDPITPIAGKLHQAKHDNEPGGVPTCLSCKRGDPIGWPKTQKLIREIWAPMQIEENRRIFGLKDPVFPYEKAAQETVPQGLDVMDFLFNKQPVDDTIDRTAQVVPVNIFRGLMSRERR